MNMQGEKTESIQMSQSSHDRRAPFFPLWWFLWLQACRRFTWLFIIIAAPWRTLRPGVSPLCSWRHVTCCHDYMCRHTTERNTAHIQEMFKCRMLFPPSSFSLCIWTKPTTLTCCLQPFQFSALWTAFLWEQLIYSLIEQIIASLIL